MRWCLCSRQLMWWFGHSRSSHADGCHRAGHTDICRLDTGGVSAHLFTARPCACILAGQHSTTHLNRASHFSTASLHTHVSLICTNTMYSPCFAAAFGDDASADDPFCLPPPLFPTTSPFLPSTQPSPFTPSAFYLDDVVDDVLSGPTLQTNPYSPLDTSTLSLPQPLPLSPGCLSPLHSSSTSATDVSHFVLTPIDSSDTDTFQCERVASFRSPVMPFPSPLVELSSSSSSLSLQPPSPSTVSLWPSPSSSLSSSLPRASSPHHQSEYSSPSPLPGQGNTHQPSQVRLRSTKVSLMESGFQPSLAELQVWMYLRILRCSPQALLVGCFPNRDRYKDRRNQLLQHFLGAAAKHVADNGSTCSTRATVATREDERKRVSIARSTKSEHHKQPRAKPRAK